MPSIVESLQSRDRGHLRIIAELWGIELAEGDDQATLQQLASLMLSADRLDKLAEDLAGPEKQAMNDLAGNAGRLPWAQFTRLYGEVREMGAARRDREHPYLAPVSAVESLWYKGLVARAFFDTPGGPEEFAYIPDDLLDKYPVPAGGGTSVIGRPASAAEYQHTYLVNDRLLDHACTLLAAMRLGIRLPNAFTTQTGEELTPQILKALLAACGFIDGEGGLLSEPVRIFLEATRPGALAQLFNSWRASLVFNELLCLPNLSFEGNWKNNPLEVRGYMLEWLAKIPAGTWWNLQAFIAGIKRNNPDFQRPAGDYDSWFIRDRLTGEYLRGFDHWDAVDGRLIQFIFTGPLHWLGVLDLAIPEEGVDVTAFRLSKWSQALLKGGAPSGLPAETEPIIARSDARLSARRLVPRRVRYQIARFCEWGKETPEEYQYQITAASLANARKQGLTVSQFLALLNRHSRAVPPSLVKALERWDKSGSEARLEKVVVLRVISPEVLQALRKSRASRYLGEPIGPAAITIKPGASQKVLAALAELGYLGEIRGEDDQP